VIPVRPGAGQAVPYRTSRLVEATDIAAAALADRFGSGAVDGKIQAHVITVER
jgi:hypothetical protein